MTEQHDDFEAQLRQRISSSETRVPHASPPRVETPSGIVGPRMRVALIAMTVAAAVVVAGLLIGRLPDRATGDASLTPSGPVSAQARGGDLVLTLSSPQSVWTTDQAIEIVAELAVGGMTGQVDLRGGIPPITFTLRQLSGGDAEIGGGQLQPCNSYPITRDAPLVVPFTKAGEVEGPPFDQAWFRDPDLHLPAGRWEVRANLGGFIGQCSADGERAQIEVSIEIEVTEATGSRQPDPTHSAAPSEQLVPSDEPKPSPMACGAALASGVLGLDHEDNPILVIQGLGPVRIEFSNPDGYRIEAEPSLTIYGNHGEVLAREGDFLQLGGGFNADDTVFTTCGMPPPPRIDPVSMLDPTTAAANAIDVCRVRDYGDATIRMGWVPSSRLSDYLPVALPDIPPGRTVWMVDFVWDLADAPYLPLRMPGPARKTDHLVCLVYGTSPRWILVGTVVDTEEQVISTPSPGQPPPVSSLPPIRD